MPGTPFTHVKFCWKIWGLSWQRVWNIRGLLWKLVGNVGSCNYFWVRSPPSVDGVACCNVLQCVAVCCSVLQDLLAAFHAASTCTITPSSVRCLLSVFVCVYACVCVWWGVCEWVCVWVRVQSTFLHSLSFLSLARSLSLVCNLTCVAVCCSVLQCVAVCCSVLRCVAVCCSVLMCVAVRCSVLQCAAVCCTALQSVAECCSAL